MNPSDEMIEVLEAAWCLLARPGNDFAWSSWNDASAAHRQIRVAIERIDTGMLPERVGLSVLFAATGPINEVAVSSGWVPEFLALAERFDEMERRLYGRNAFD